MYLAEIEFFNWGRFRGRHLLSLKPEAYGVACEWDHNPLRSNFGGKSLALEGMFPFVFFGKHRHRTEDAWITNGEPEGYVRAVLVDGAARYTVKRSRKRGSSTKLTFDGDVPLADNPEAGGDLFWMGGDVAQLEIERLIGLSFADFENSAYFGQKQMGRFVSDRPGDRMDIVAGWFRLGPLEQAADAVGEELASVLAEVVGKDTLIESCRGAIVLVVSSFGTDDPDAEGEAARVAQQAATVAYRSAEKRLVDLEAARATYVEVREYHRVVAEGKALRAKVEGYYDELPTEEFVRAARERLDDAIGSLGVLRDAVETKRTLARGAFDGVCPVAGISCPAREEINASTKKNAELLADVTHRYNQAARARQQAQDELLGAQAARARYEEDKRARGVLVTRAKGLRLAAERIVDLMAEPTDADLGIAKGALWAARESLGAADDRCKQLAKAAELLRRHQEATEVAVADRNKLVARVVLLQEARRVLVEAQRQIARDNLAEIERGANYALAQCGVDLTLRVSWERETKDLAKWCEDCGAPYPNSRKVKRCERCGSPRGAHYERRFEVAPSSQSGGADDLAGIATQLAAAAWMRADRDARWATAILDEPASALDQEHKRALMAHLPRLLREFGFEQAFICAHDASAMSAMPNMVEIVAGPTDSKFKGGPHGDEDRDRAEDRAGPDADAPAGPSRQAEPPPSGVGVGGGVRVADADPGAADQLPGEQDRGGGVGSRRRRAPGQPSGGAKPNGRKARRPD